MNPYDFVRLDPEARVERKPFCRLDRYGANAWITGRMEGTIEALRPIFLPRPRSGTPKQFLRSDARHAAIIPGSSLKGLFRSVVETVAPGCWWLFEGTYKDKNNGVDYREKLPRQYKHCSDIDRLCPACRLFGMLGNPGALLGKVAFEDAVCFDERPHTAGYTPPLAGPKPRHSAWYLSGDHVVGRKFYFHHEQPEFSSTRPAAAMQMVQNLQPLG
ncbi:MAG: RAMP superfamily CRISPR-associated protein, partial [Bacillota bacterium]|nr:RAMP superfamily CRISPR-associated protein [Bacillota bacterium]